MTSLLIALAVLVVAMAGACAYLIVRMARATPLYAEPRDLLPPELRYLLPVDPHRPARGE